MIITDLDNTLYDWNSYFARSFRAMLHAVARETKLEEDLLYREWTEVYRRHESVEYPLSIQELPSIASRPMEEVQHLIRAGRGAANSVRRTMTPYPGVVDTLEWLRYQGYAIVGVTNGPIWIAQKRAWDLQLDRLLNGLIAWIGPTNDPDSQVFAAEYFKKGGPGRAQTRVEWYEWVERPDRKPAPHAYLTALKRIGSDPATCWVVGDSIDKDLAPAAEIGAHTVFAKYGTEHLQSDMDTLFRITHWTESEITNQYHSKSIEPEHVIMSFDELRSIVPKNRPERPIQVTLFDED